MQGRLFHILTLFLIGLFVTLGVSIGASRAVTGTGSCTCNDNQSIAVPNERECTTYCSAEGHGGVKSFTETPGGQTIELKNPLGKTETFIAVLNSITKFLREIGAAIVVIMILVAGFLYMTAGGNKEKVTTAHKTLTYALVGYGIILVASGLVIVLRKILGG